MEAVAHTGRMNGPARVQAREQPGRALSVAGGWRAVTRRYLAAQVAVCLWFGPYLAVFLRDDSRYFYLWQRRDALCLLAAMMLIAVAAVAVREGLALIRRPILTRLCDHLFVVVLGGALLTNLAYHFTRSHGYSIGQFGMETRTGWLIVVAVAAHAFGRPSSKLVLRCRQLCQIVSPAMVILAVQLLRPAYYAPTYDPLPVAPVAGASRSTLDGTAAPIHLFIFDEWSYQRTFEAGRPFGGMTHLGELASEAVVFHDAHAPGTRTKESLPRTLYQNDLPIVVDRGRLGFTQDGGFVPAETRPSLFSTMEDRSYETVMIGFLLPYRMWLGDGVGTCRSYPYYPRGNGPLESIAFHALKTGDRSTDPWLSFAYRKLHPRLNHDFFIGLHEAMHRDALHVLKDAPRRTFSVIHYPLPHKPFLFRPDGSLRGPHDGVYEDTVEGYMGNLLHLDRVIGGFTTALKDAGRYKDALLILTSDHGWRHDPAWPISEKRPATHVPLIVKLPGQTEARNVSARVELRELGGLIRYIADGGTDPDAAIAALLEPAAMETRPGR